MEGLIQFAYILSGIVGMTMLMMYFLTGDDEDLVSITVLFAIFIGGAIFFALKEDEEIKKYKIKNVQDVSKSELNVLMGTGGSSVRDYYSLYVFLDESTLKRMRVTSYNTLIREKDTVPTLIVKPSNETIQTYSYEIIIPKGTVLQNYLLDNQ